MNSKIWDEFEKTAIEQGLVSVDDIEKTADYASARIGTDTEEKIRMLYGLGDSDKEDLIEKAHPETAVVAPTYDGMNAVLENINQRSDMMKYLALKHPDGVLTGRRYVHYDQGNYTLPKEEEESYNFKEASDNLLHALVRTGFAADNNGDEEIAKLADSCANRLVKVSAPWALLFKTVVRVAPVLLGYTAFVNHFPVSKGLENDLNTAIVQLEEGRQHAYPQVQDTVSSILEVLKGFKQIHDTYIGIGKIDINLANPQPEELVTVSQDEESLKKMRIARAYIKSIEDLIRYLPGAIEQLESAKTRGADWGNWLAGIMKAYRFIVPSEVEDMPIYLNKLLETLKEELIRVKATVNKTNALAQDKAKELVIRFKERAEGAESPTEGAIPELSDIS